MSADQVIQKTGFYSLCLFDSLYESREVMTSACDLLSAKTEYIECEAGNVLWGLCLTEKDIFHLSKVTHCGKWTSVEVTWAYHTPKECVLFFTEICLPVFSFVSN